MQGRRTRVSAEGFALVGDVHVWRGELAPDDVTGRRRTGAPPRAAAGERLARAICADREMMDDAAVTAMADALAAAQASQRGRGDPARVRRHPSTPTRVVTGLGAFIAGRAARAAGLESIALADAHGDDAARCAPAAAVALLLENGARSSRFRHQRAAIAGRIDAVVKVGGGLLGARGER